MEVNTKAAFSLISETSFRDFWPCHKLDKVDIHLCTYSGEFITVLGSTTVSISQQATVELAAIWHLAGFYIGWEFWRGKRGVRGAHRIIT